MNRLLLLAPRIATNRLWARAGAVPSFHIAPARTQNARDLITGSVLGSYNSASPAWAVGPDGVLFLPAANAPVIEYDPATLQCLGARIWGAVTNLFTYSSTFTDSAWAKSNVTITANSATSPTGATDASLVSPLNSGSQSRNFRQSYTTSTAGTYTFSIYVKINTLTSASLALRIRNQSSSVGAYSNWNTNTFLFGSFNSTGGWTGSTEVKALQNGWFRLSLTVTTTSSSHTALISELWPGGLAGTLDTIGSPLVWGAQLQAGDIGPYVPTTTAAASSTADAWSITGADFSRIYNPSAVSLFLEGQNFSDGGRIYFEDNTLGASDRWDLRLIGSSWGMRSTSATVNDGSATVGPNTPLFKVAGAIAENSMGISLNGSVTANDTSLNMPQNIEAMWIGSFRGASAFANGYIRELAIFRSRRPNTNLQAMTS